MESIYLAMYSSCTPESDYWPLSAHRTYQGAQAAISAHKRQMEEEHNANPYLRDKYPWSDEHGNGMQGWDVHMMEVLP